MTDTPGKTKGLRKKSGEVLFETSSKTARRRRERYGVQCENDAVEEANTRESMLSAIVVDGKDDDNSPESFGPPGMERGSVYKIKDDCVNGTYELCDIVAGRAVLYVFKNIETGTKTTYTPYALSEFNTGGRNGTMKRVSPHRESGRRKK